MSFDPASLFASLVISTVGFGIFRYGRKLDRLPQMGVGLALLVFPYFVSTLWMMLVIAGGLLTFLWLATR